MGLVLQIIGGVVVSIILIIIVFYVFIRLKFGKHLNYDAEANQTPLCVHLNEDFSADWLNISSVQKLV